MRYKVEILNPLLTIDDDQKEIVRGRQDIAKKVKESGKEYVPQRLSQSREKAEKVPKGNVKRARVIPLNDDDSGMRPEHNVQVNYYQHPYHTSHPSTPFYQTTPPPDSAHHRSVAETCTKFSSGGQNPLDPHDVRGIRPSALSE